MQRIAITLLVLLVASANLMGSEPPKGIHSMHLSKATLHKGDNVTRPGSCVQCACTHIGYHCGDPAAASLLINSEYGPAVLHGSTPSRIAAVFNQRHIKAYNVTGAQTTKRMMEFAVRTHRFAAIGFTPAHFETLAGKDFDTGEWLVINNQLQTDMETERYSDAEFMRHHMESGPWCIVLQQPGSDPPELVEWWK